VTRRDIARMIADQLGCSQLQIRQIIEQTFDAIVNTLVEEKRIELRNFGVFEVRWRKARKARNPNTGERVMVPKKCTVVFKPGQVLAERVHAKGRSVATAGKTPKK
jgi:integration host factor subunit beta